MFPPHRCENVYTDNVYRIVAGTGRCCNRAGGNMPNRTGRRATLRQVAALAGVSIATASRAINGAVASPMAAARVQAAVGELDYFPDTAARSLRKNRTMTI